MAHLPRVLCYPGANLLAEALHGRACEQVHRASTAPPIVVEEHRRWVVEHRTDWDLVHVHAGDGWADDATVGAIVAAHRQAGAPVVATLHACPAEPSEAGRALAEALADECASLIAFTAHDAEVFMRVTGRRPDVVPHGPVLTASERRRVRRRRRLTLLADADERLRAVVLAAGNAARIAWADVAGAVRSIGRLAVTAGVLPDEFEVVDAYAGGLERFTVVTDPTWDTGRKVDQLVRSDVVLHPDGCCPDPRLVELAADVGVPVVGTVSSLPEERWGVVTVPDLTETGTLADALAVAVDVGEIPERERACAESMFLEGHRRLYADHRRPLLHRSEPLLAPDLSLLRPRPKDPA